MPKIMDYVLITSSKGILNLETLIKENIRLGWQPIGGVSVMNPIANTDDKPVAVQAMVKYDE